MSLIPNISKRYTITGLVSLLFLTGCGSSDEEFVQQPDARINGVWASNCQFSPESGLYETVDYELRGSNAAILISTYDDRFCTRLLDDALYEGTVSQTGTLILGNGLTANELQFNTVDRETNTQLVFRSYFQSDSLYLYEYPDASSNFAYEYQRV